MIIVVLRAIFWCGNIVCQFADFSIFNAIVMKMPAYVALTFYRIINTQNGVLTRIRTQFRMLLEKSWEICSYWRSNIDCKTKKIEKFPEKYENKAQMVANNIESKEKDAFCMRTLQ